MNSTNEMRRMLLPDERTNCSFISNPSIIIDPRYRLKIPNRMFITWMMAKALSDSVQVCPWRKKVGRSEEMPRFVARNKERPANPDDLLKRPGWKETTHPEAGKKGHRTFENKKTGEKIRHDAGKPGETGHKAQDHCRR